MKIIDMEQQTPEWFELRKEFYKTASRTATVLGIDPFSDKNKLASEIKFNVKPFQTKKMKLGNVLEDMIRLKANELLKDVFEPKVGLNVEYLASLDGINFEGDTIIEIKVSEKTYKDLKEGIIPKNYYAQLQHQLLVFEDAEQAYLIAYSAENDDIAISEPILNDLDYQNLIKESWSKFDTFLELFELPKELDIIGSELNEKMKEILEMQKEFKALETKIKDEKEKLLEQIANKEDYKKINFVGGSIEIRKGAKRPNYKKYFEDNRIELEDKYYSEGMPTYIFKNSKEIK